jgi:hypothetical protein
MFEKTCTKCKCVKLNTEFNKRAVTLDGLTSFCKACNSEYLKQKRQKNKNNAFIAQQKKCSKCKIIKSSDFFYKKKASPDGLNYYCKDCCAIEEARLIIANKSKTIIADNKMCATCKQILSFEHFYISKSEASGLRSMCRMCTQKWRQEKYKNDITFRLKLNVTSCISAAVSNRKINSVLGLKFRHKVFDHLPYTIDQLKFHIESLWEPWMNWGNYGQYKAGTWQIDHIFPQSKLPYDSFEHPNFLKCWALENLRPLETIANIKKGNKIIDIKNKRIGEFVQS